MNIQENYSLLRHNTFGIDARCRRFIEYGSVEEARQLAIELGRTSGDAPAPDSDRTQACSAASQPLLIIGSGSNLLLTRDFPGTVVHSVVKGFSRHDSGPGEVSLTVGSGETWDDVVARSVADGLHGAENLSLIPGEVGAAAVQNIGAYGAEVCQLIKEVEAVEIGTGRVCRIAAADCHYGYRQSRFKSEWQGRFLITHVTLRLLTDAPLQLDYGNIRQELDRRAITAPTPEDVRQVVAAIRRAKLPDPAVEGNAGSFFMNPVVSREKFRDLQASHPDMPHYPTPDGQEKIPAGWMIDQCGWKGRSLGRAGVHDRQALVLVNRGGATAQEITELCHRIQADVQERFGVMIHPEVNIV